MVSGQLPDGAERDEAREIESLDTKILHAQVKVYIRENLKVRVKKETEMVGAGRDSFGIKRLTVSLLLDDQVISFESIVL